MHNILNEDSILVLDSLKPVAYITNKAAETTVWTPLNVFSATKFSLTKETLPAVTKTGQMLTKETLPAVRKISGDVPKEWMVSEFLEN